VLYPVVKWLYLTHWCWSGFNTTILRRIAWGSCHFSKFSSRTRHTEVFVCLFVKWLVHFQHRYVEELVSKLDFWYLSIYVKQTVWMYLWPIFMHEQQDQSPSNFVQISAPTQRRFLIQVWPCQLNPLTPGYPKLQNLNRSRRKNFVKHKMFWWVT